jgi:hypothetical protein
MCLLLPSSGEHDSGAAEGLAPTWGCLRRELYLRRRTICLLTDEVLGVWRQPASTHFVGRSTPGNKRLKMLPAHFLKQLAQFAVGVATVDQGFHLPV